MNRDSSGVSPQNDKNSLFGVLNIYKPVGMTSHDVVAVLRRVTKIKQIGHTGTLDPLAQGVLPVCIGKATRLIEFLNDDKEYLATVQFGASTTTYDLEGEKVQVFDKKVTKSEVENGLKDFEGEISQFPPIYSAIKVKGKKLYEYARNGEDVEIQSRTITIEKIELKSFDGNAQQAEILIKCSKGTYIRSIAHDLGQNLNCGGHLIKLVRTKVGNFKVEESVQLEGIDVEANLINPIVGINLEKIEVCKADLENIKCGRALKNKNIKHGEIVLLIYNNNEICAVGVAEGESIKLKKVFM